jgi:hypothetical protein
MVPFLTCYLICPDNPTDSEKEMAEMSGGEAFSTVSSDFF